MTTKPSDLINIANPELSKKLQKKAEKEAKKQQTNKLESSNEQDSAHHTFKQDVWRAVFILNLMRYGLALCLLIITALKQIRPDITFIEQLLHPGLFLASTIILLISAIAFSFFTSTRKAPLSTILITQFIVDVVLAGIMVHSTGSISSTFTLAFFVIVTTGSVVLRRKHALALASGAIIIMFYEHVHSVLSLHTEVKANFSILAGYAIFLMGVALMISALAQRLRHAELRKFIPGNESIEDYLVREEVTALKSALASSNGNKTEAAKLLGMSFRSFRYKLTKYDIG